MSDDYRPWTSASPIADSLPPHIAGEAARLEHHLKVELLPWQRRLLDNIAADREALTEPRRPRLVNPTIHHEVMDAAGQWWAVDLMREMLGVAYDRQPWKRALTDANHAVLELALAEASIPGPIVLPAEAADATTATRARNCKSPVLPVALVSSALSGLVQAAADHEAQEARRRAVERTER